jgi:hypothetical protein
MVLRPSITPVPELAQRPSAKHQFPIRNRDSPSPRGRYMFTVAAGILPAVEPGILPGGNGVLSGKALAIWRPRPGGKMPPSTAAKMAAATHLPPTLNTYRGSG